VVVLVTLPGEGQARQELRPVPDSPSGVPFWNRVPQTCMHSNPSKSHNPVSDVEARFFGRVDAVWWGGCHSGVVELGASVSGKLDPGYPILSSNPVGRAAGAQCCGTQGWERRCGARRFAVEGPNRAPSKLGESGLRFPNEIRNPC